MFDRTTLPKFKTVAVPISVGDFADHISEIVRFGHARVSSYACMVNTHMTVEAYRDPGFKEIVESADLATADGMPVLRSLQVFHQVKQERVAGNDVLPAVLDAAEREGLSVYFIGGSEDVLEQIRSKVASEFPCLCVAGTSSPPFRELTGHEEQEIVQVINNSGANIVFVSFGCPKQEYWMARMKGRINAMMLGVGGAFSLYAGIDSRAPRWMRDLSLDWLYRLAREPRRLWKRYLINNSWYVFLFLKTWLTGAYKS